MGLQGWDQGVGLMIWVKTGPLLCHSIRDQCGHTRGLRPTLVSCFADPTDNQWYSALPLTVMIHKLLNCSLTSDNRPGKTITKSLSCHEISK